MTRANPIVSAVKSKPSFSKTVSRSYPLRSQSSKSALHVTPSKLSPVKYLIENQSRALHL